jgi:uracil-DNA glycosylase family protein
LPPKKPPRTEDFFPERKDLASLRQAAQNCRGCALYLRATQTVFGEGPGTARVVVVGEQPGDVEDVAGRPFVGPAGRLLDKALAEAGLDRESLYLTNAVKHFSFEERGKRRIHKKPRQSEVRACRPWLEAELAAIRPDVLVLLGATAAQAILGPGFRVSEQRGTLVPSNLAPIAVATVHPSSILRAPDDAARELGFRAIVHDLRVAAKALAARRQGG